MNAHHSLVQSSSQHSSHMRKQPRYPKPGVSSLDRRKIGDMQDMQDISHLEWFLPPSQECQQAGGEVSGRVDGRPGIQTKTGINKRKKAQ